MTTATMVIFWKDLNDCIATTCFDFIRRVDGSTSFDHEMSDYTFGFRNDGGLEHDHWLSLETLHQMTKNASEPMTLRFQVTNCSGVTWFGEFQSFQVMRDTTPMAFPNVPM